MASRFAKQSTRIEAPEAQATALSTGGDHSLPTARRVAEGSHGSVRFKCAETFTGHAAPRSHYVVAREGNRRVTARRERNGYGCGTVVV